MTIEIVLIAIVALIFLVQWLDSLETERRARRAKEQAEHRQLMEMLKYQDSLKDFVGRLREMPLDPSAHGDVLKSMGFQTNAGATGFAYESVLALLAQQPQETLLRQLALKAGRIHYGKVRGGEASFEDEQRIMNDIQVRLM
ncbi:MAG: hypothetical protein MH825_17195 [Cyanobacteria bacterium]|nr:hypothetical protein [Cyanobacteriota bacterium]